VRDETSQQVLRSYYSKIIATYSLKDALRDGVLAPYEYDVIEVHLTEEESELYKDLSEKIAPLMARKEDGLPINEEQLRALLLARMRIVGSASEKYTALDALVSDSAPRNHTLFYVGDGSTELDSDVRPMRDVERVAAILSKNRWKSSRFTAEESQHERARILENFRYGYINAIVAIRVLDEGFDIPECQTAYFLASSRNERQFIQRRGRILRTAASKSKARIIDFLVEPSPQAAGPSMNSLVRQELVRAFEFARFAINGKEMAKRLENVAARFDLEVDAIMEEVATLGEFES
jgi:superfamily II DNA or RNA helicase